MYEHQSGANSTAYTFSRRPVELVWSGEFATRREALDFEYQVKGWSRAKKESLIRNDWDGIHQIVKAERKTREAEKQKLKALSQGSSGAYHSRELQSRTESAIISIFPPFGGG